MSTIQDKIYQLFDNVNSLVETHIQKILDTAEFVPGVDNERYCLIAEISRDSNINYDLTEVKLICQKYKIRVEPLNTDKLKVIIYQN